MNVSVIIPAYNAEKTIDETLRSVLDQNRKPSEIIVFDDGSSDSTLKILQKYIPYIKILSRPNGGVAKARNCLCAAVSGDIIAFLDADDIWHPQYLELQIDVFERHPETTASFTGHVTFQGHNTFNWPTLGQANEIESIKPLDFFRRYQNTPINFLPSFCCVSRKFLELLGPEPFPPKASGADDYFMTNMLPLYGPVVFREAQLVAYRNTVGSISSDRVHIYKQTIEALILLRPFYSENVEHELSSEFDSAFASQRRTYAKHLMGAGEASEAKNQIMISLNERCNFKSKFKSMCLFLLMNLPRRIQPKWPVRYRA